VTSVLPISGLTSGLAGGTTGNGKPGKSGSATAGLGAPNPLASLLGSGLIPLGGLGALTAQK
jgi:hypothetical protein